MFGGKLNELDEYSSDWGNVRDLFPPYINMAAWNKSNHRESWSALSRLGTSGQGRVRLLPLCALVCGWSTGRAGCCRGAHAIGCADRTVLDSLVMRAAGDGHLLTAVLLIEHWNRKATWGKPKIKRKKNAVIRISNLHQGSLTNIIICII